VTIMQATTTGRTTGQMQPSILAAAFGLLIAAAVVVGVLIAQRAAAGAGSPAAAPAPFSRAATERALLQVRLGEHTGLSTGWANQGPTGSALQDLEDQRAGAAVIRGTSGEHGFLSSISKAGQTGATSGRPVSDGLSSNVPDNLSAGSPSAPALVAQRAGERGSLATDAPDHYQRAGFSPR
jgi:hypothetical protein